MSLYSIRWNKQTNEPWSKYMSKAPPVKKKTRVPAQVQFDPDLLQLARLHRIEKRENVSDLINRVLRQVLQSSEAAR